MFHPTNAHRHETAPGQASIRLGARVPPDAVSLAYSHVRALHPLENVQIADTSGFIIENMTAQEAKDIHMWPDKGSLLRAWDGSPYIRSQNVLVTNVFDDGVPLYYMHELAHPVMESASQAELEFYEGTAITMHDQLQNPLTGDKRCKIKLIPTDRPRVYQVRIFTSFQTQPDEQVIASYTAVTDTAVVPGFQETLNPRPAYTKVTRVQDAGLYDKHQMRYYQMNGREVGQTQVFLPVLPIRDITHRQPVPFRYVLEAEATWQEGDEARSVTLTSPPIYDSLFHKDSLSSAEDGRYQNGYKRLSEQTSLEMLARYGDVTPFANPDARVRVTVRSLDPNVSIETHASGNQSVHARTHKPTGKLALPAAYRVQEAYPQVSYQIVLREDETETVLRGTLSRTDGIVKLTGPLSGTVSFGLPRIYDPITVFLDPRDHCLYAFTEETDTYYLPTFSVRLNDSRQIKVASPAEKRATENWYVRVKNGQFERRTTSATGYPVLDRYSVSEYFKQDFDDTYGMPYRKVTSEKPEVVSDHKLRLRYAPLFIQPEEQGYNIRITVNGIEVGVRSWNASEGTVDIDTQVQVTDAVLVDYYYEEFHYTYRGYWDKATQRFWHLDLNPAHGHFYTDQNPDTGDVVESPGVTLVNRTVYLYIKPAARFGIDEEKQAQELVHGSYEPYTLFHAFAEVDRNEHPDVILLAKIQVRPNSSLESVQLIDTRVRGGGLKESITRAVMQQVAPESLDYWDVGYWDGEPYPENGVIVVRLPKHILVEHGGRFTKEEAEGIVKNHAGFGTFVVTEFVDEAPHIIETPQGGQAIGRP